MDEVRSCEEKEGGKKNWRGGCVTANGEDCWEWMWGCESTVSLVKHHPDNYHCTGWLGVKQQVSYSRKEVDDLFAFLRLSAAPAVVRNGAPSDSLYNLRLFSRHGTHDGRPGKFSSVQLMTVSTLSAKPLFARLSEVSQALLLKQLLVQKIKRPEFEIWTFVLNVMNDSHIL